MLLSNRRALGSRQVQSIYQITYSRANEEIVPNRESFVQLVRDSFDNADPLTRCEIVQWVCSQERQRDGGIHYHMAVKLNARRRWLKIHNYLDQRHRVKMHFSAHPIAIIIQSGSTQQRKTRVTYSLITSPI